jgi:hypothetical protein
MRRASMIRFGAGFAAILLYAGVSRGTLIDFEDKTGPSLFSLAGPAQTLVYNVGGVTVTFAGGVILTAATNLPADETSLYGTASANLIPGASTTLTNPLTVTFSKPIQNFFLDVYNGETSAETYTLADNAGHSSTFSLGPNTASGQSEIGFAATGTGVTLTSGSSADWDFFIDNVHFNESLPTVPEPATWLEITVAGVAALGLGLFRRIRTA